MKINMLGVFTDRFAEMKRFYVDVLGFEVLEELEKYVEFSGQPVRVALCERSVMQDVTGDAAFERPATGSTLEFAFECGTREELDERYNGLLAAGAREVKRPSVMPWGQYAGFFADPDGNVHELFVHASN
ncbi:MAG: VOC family protein [Planctomycetota bacterium]